MIKKMFLPITMLLSISAIQADGHLRNKTTLAKVVDVIVDDMSFDACLSQGKRLAGLPQEDIIPILMRTCIKCSQDLYSGTEASLLKDEIIQYTYKTTYDYVSKFANQTAADKIANSHAGNVRAITERS